jgi:hypothetical protein
VLGSGDLLDFSLLLGTEPNGVHLPAVGSLALRTDRVGIVLGLFGLAAEPVG